MLKVLSALFGVAAILSSVAALTDIFIRFEFTIIDLLVLSFCSAILSGVLLQQHENGKNKDKESAVSR